MSILNALAKRQGAVVALDGISDGVFECTLYRLGISQEDIADLKLEPVENREFILNYYEGKQCQI